jgi:hypothetical protein
MIDDYNYCFIFRLKAKTCFLYSYFYEEKIGYFVFEAYKYDSKQSVSFIFQIRNFSMNYTMISLFIWLLLVGALEPRIIRKRQDTSCSWAGHCAGDPCSTDDDCDGSLTCNNGVCGDGNSCSWTGHCAGDPCSTDDDCDGSLTCNNGVCGSGSGSSDGNSCSWAGHCAGDSCSTDNDCDGSLTCSNGVCGDGGGSSNNGGSSGTCSPSGELQGTR